MEHSLGELHTENDTSEGIVERVTCQVATAVSIHHGDRSVWPYTEGTHWCGDAERTPADAKVYAVLVKCGEFLEALRQGGVDNWDWYSESLENYRKSNNLPDDYFDEI